MPLPKLSFQNRLKITPVLILNSNITKLSLVMFWERKKRKFLKSLYKNILKFWVNNTALSLDFRLDKNHNLDYWCLPEIDIVCIIIVTQVSYFCFPQITCHPFHPNSSVDCKICHSGNKLILDYHMYQELKTIIFAPP